MDDVAVKVEKVSKIYKSYARPSDRLKEILSGGKKIYHQPIVALNDVSFTVRKGTTFGILGHNGSGKSTILQIITSVLQPSSGTVSTNGRISALLELGSGFNPEFSGVDNVYLYASILGLSEEEIDARLEGILRFADIGEFINYPIKTYSSGMAVRLAFSVAVAIEPDILVVDEALAVGDALFQHKCILRMREIMENGSTVIFVSHDIGTVKSLCKEAVLLESGKLVASGKADEVATEYQRRLFAREVSRDEPAAGSSFCLATTQKVEEKSVASRELSTRPNPPSPSQLEAFSKNATSSRFGTGEAHIIYTEILNLKHEPVSLVDYGERFIIRIHIKFHEDCSSAIAGYVLRNSKGIDLIASNTHIEHMPLHNVRAEEILVVDFEQENMLRDDHYSVNVAVTHEQFFHQVRHYDWVDNAAIFRAGKPLDTIVYGMFYPTDVKTRFWKEESVSADTPTAINT